MSGIETKQVPAIAGGTRVVVVGLGKSGLSAVRFLRALGAEVRVSDAGSGAVPAAVTEGLARDGIACEFGGHTEKFCLWADLLLVSPGVPHRLEILQLARKAGLPVVGELALAARYLKTSVVAVTGTNGKTTVTTLLGELFRAAGSRVFVGGNIGVPLTDYLAGPQDADWVILEVSSFQLDTAGGFRPEIGLLLNVTPDHLDRYDSYPDYIASKLSLFQHQREGDVAIFNGQEVDSLQQARRSKLLPEARAARRTLYFGRDLAGLPGAEYREGVVRLQGESRFAGEEYELHNPALRSPPNLANSAAAILAARLAACARSGIKKGLAAFQPLPHRMTLVAVKNGVQYIDDSKATNIGAVCAALRSLTAPVILIAGGRDKGGGYRLMRELVGQKVKVLLLIGEARELMAGSFREVTAIELMESMAQAVNRAAQLAAPGDVVLLSPACASFDMFTSYGHRGQVFQKLVAGLGQYDADLATET